MSNYSYIERNPAKIYKDVNLAFTKHPTSRDVTKKTNEESIKQSLKSLLLLGRNDKPFHPEISGGVYDMLFENFDAVGTEDILEIKIADLIDRFEPRIDLLGIETNFLTDQNAVSITIYYVIVTTLVETQTEIYLAVAR